MLARLLRVVLTTIVVVVACPHGASAQIYAWRDESGNLVLSDKAKDPAVQTFAVSTTGVVRTTMPRIAGRRGAIYDAVIEQHATANNVSPDLIRAVIQAESAYNPSARSGKGAMGLMQLMPATAVEYGVSDPFDPVQNIRAGVAYLKSLLRRYSDNVELALAAYNAGPTAVAKYGTVPPYRETRNYVQKIQAAAGPPKAAAHLYRTIEIVNGREVTRYSNVKTAGAEVVQPGGLR